MNKPDGDRPDQIQLKENQPYLMTAGGVDNKTVDQKFDQKTGRLWKNEHKDRLVFIADIMGFKELVRNDSNGELAAKLRQFMTDLYKRLSPFKSGMSHIRVAVFSDSIALATDSTSKDNWRRMARAVTILMLTAKSFDMPMKGCISKGRFIFDQDTDRPLFFGPAGIDAHLQQEEMFFFGVSVHKSAENDIPTLNDEIKKFFRFVKLPFKTGHSRHYVFDWHLVRTERDPLGEDEYIKWLERYEMDNNARVRSYVINTIEAVKDVI